ncbi:hypothetical protein CKO38_15870 [Rhodospirillum rubrum]|uniref:hypothetical protein n=1 Tax=Rhodospirillum rubrum TaxID=1085 RepID=UPI001904E11E|nr:hypothetical protein [Rhodospirillum rubrum]MBK1666108.1 hypothetical protein [Rhodospirillum rubrum]MBK1678120.1 hypothetical protein [Rhodospirillum rubrum]
MTDAAEIRRAIVDALPITTSNYGELPDLGQVYVPPSHLRALRLDCNLVIGARGVGKSFWASALRLEGVRQQLGESLSPLTKTDVFAGFGTQPDIEFYPDGDTFSGILSQERTPYDVWRAVVARRLSAIIGLDIPKGTWKETVDWVSKNPEPFALLQQNANIFFRDEGKACLIVFDALDRTSSDWRTMDNIVRELLRVILQMKAHSLLHGKVFLREDQFHRTITDFPDASKLLATRVELSWAPHDLHGLLWQLLCNASGKSGECLRGVYKSVLEEAPIEQAGVWLLREDSKREGKAQRELFERLAGKWMGRDRRRGIPYTWSVSHLEDARRHASPRSFIAAIGTAADVSNQRYPEHSYPLHYESIKLGVQKASEIRVSEMAEDYQWVKTLMEPLRGITVPCDFSMIEECWNTSFPQGAGDIGSNHLPPQRIEQGWQGIREDLQGLGIFEAMKDGRLNMPDLYRVGFGLGRRGGVKPMRAGSR